jgi:hypothetical protein
MIYFTKSLEFDTAHECGSYIQERLVKCMKQGSKDMIETEICSSKNVSCMPVRLSVLKKISVGALHYPGTCKHILT